MEINKAAQAASSGAPTAVQLEAINNLAKAHLTAQQVYVFSLRLCDDQVDRDFERFDSAALPGLAKLFIGKTGIVDHKWSSDKQVARIFQTEVVREDGAEFIKAWAYIRRGDANDEIIADIEAGIKKEVSMGVRHGALRMLHLRERLRFLRASERRKLRRAGLLRHFTGADGRLRVFLCGRPGTAGGRGAEGAGLRKAQAQGTGR